MLDYFYKCNYTLFTEEVRSELREYALANSKMFTKHQNLTEGTYDGNHVMFLPLDANKIIQRLEKKCILSTYVVIIKHPPKQVVIRHTDGVVWAKNSVLCVPLTLTNHSSTYFWESYSSEEPAAILTYNNSLPVVLNTSKIHSLENTTDNDRFSLQFCFKQPIDILIHHLSNNTLFNPTL